MAEITVFGLPVGKQRARTVVKGGKVMSYTPLKTREFEKKVALCYKIAKAEFFEDKPISAKICVYFPLTKEQTRKMQKNQLQPSNLACKTRIDLDNVCKSVFDGLNGVAYIDDKQVVHIEATKQYDFEPRVEIQLEVWNGREKNVH